MLMLLRTKSAGSEFHKKKKKNGQKKFYYSIFWLLSLNLHHEEMWDNLLKQYVCSLSRVTTHETPSATNFGSGIWSNFTPMNAYLALTSCDVEMKCSNYVVLKTLQSSSLLLRKVKAGPVAKWKQANKGLNCPQQSCAETMNMVQLNNHWFV